MMAIKFIYRSVTNAKLQKVGTILSKVYGISRCTSIRICRQMGISFALRLAQIPFAKKLHIEAYFRNKVIDQSLKRIVRNNINNKIRSGSYKGLRISQHLPARGQRSKTNAQTSKKLKISKIKD
jgi:small subunit ribosomal protein S13